MRKAWRFLLLAFQAVFSGSGGNGFSTITATQYDANKQSRTVRVDNPNNIYGYFAYNDYGDTVRILGTNTCVIANSKGKFNYYRDVGSGGQMSLSAGYSDAQFTCPVLAKHDTLIKHDTTIRWDTLRLLDSVYFRDTVYSHDTALSANIDTLLNAYGVGISKSSQFWALFALGAGVVLLFRVQAWGFQAIYKMMRFGRGREE